MSLPDVSRLVDLEPAAYRALGDRLRALSITGDSVRTISRIAARAIHPLQQAMRGYHLAKLRDPAGYAMRLFVFRDAVDEGQAREVLGDAVSLERLLEVGLIAREPDGRLRCPFYVNLVNELYVMCDDLTQGDGVMGLGHTTGDLCGASWPTRKLDSVLEVGCGAGTALLVCALRARREGGSSAKIRICRSS